MNREVDNYKRGWWLVDNGEELEGREVVRRPIRPFLVDVMPFRKDSGEPVTGEVIYVHWTYDSEFHGKGFDFFKVKFKTHSYLINSIKEGEEIRYDKETG